MRDRDYNGSDNNTGEVADGNTDSIKFHPQCAGETPRISAFLGDFHSFHFKLFNHDSLALITCFQFSKNRLLPDKIFLCRYYPGHLT